MVIPDKSECHAVIYILSYGQSIELYIKSIVYLNNLIYEAMVIFPVNSKVNKQKILHTPLTLPLPHL